MSDYGGYTLAAAADNNVVICASNFDEGGGGVARFDGEAITVESTAFSCREPFAFDEGVWAIGGDSRGQVWGRMGSTWTEQTVVDGESHRFETMFHHSELGVVLVGVSEIGRPDERGAWHQPDDDNVWHPVEGAPPVPYVEVMTTVLGAFSGDGVPVYFGEEGASGASMALPQLNAMRYDCPMSRVPWAAGTNEQSFVALDGLNLREYSHGSWTTVATCPDLPTEEEAELSWTSADQHEATEHIYLAGGRGSNGDCCDDDWRLHRYNGSTVTRVLAPCPSDNCSIFDVDTSEGRVFFIGSNRWNPALMWIQL